jgi:hypothetical protein
VARQVRGVTVLQVGDAGVQVGLDASMFSVGSLRPLADDAESATDPGLFLLEQVERYALA